MQEFAWSPDIGVTSAQSSPHGTDDGVRVHHHKEITKLQFFREFFSVGDCKDGRVKSPQQGN